MSANLLRRLARLETRRRPLPCRIVTLIDDGSVDIDAEQARYRRDIGLDVEFIVFAIVDPPARERLQ